MIQWGLVEVALAAANACLLTPIFTTLLQRSGFEV